MNLSALFFIAAVVVFVLALIGVAFTNMVVLGLALVAAGLAVGASRDVRVG